MTSLTEKMARSMCERQYPNFNSGQIDDYWEEWIPDAKSALAVALEEIGEECAKVAQGWLDSDYDESANIACQNIRDDIRARIAEMKADIA